MQATCDGCFACQSYLLVFSLHPDVSRTVHPWGISDGSHQTWMHMPIWASDLTFHFFLFFFCRKPTEPVKMIACVVWQSPLKAIQRRAWVTVSTSLSSWRFRPNRLHCRSSWMVVAPCLTVKPHPDWSLVTEPSVYTMRSCGLLLFLFFVFLLLFLSEKLDLWLCFAWWPFSTLLSQVLWKDRFIGMAKSVWVPFPLPDLFDHCQLVYL